MQCIHLSWGYCSGSLLYTHNVYNNVYYVCRNALLHNTTTPFRKCLTPYVVNDIKQSNTVIGVIQYAYLCRNTPWDGFVVHTYTWYAAMYTLYNNVTPFLENIVQRMSTNQQTYPIKIECNSCTHVTYCVLRT